MINPNKLHRAKAQIAFNGRDKIVLIKGTPVECFVDLNKFEVGEIVNIQAQYSIMLDQYVIRTVRKIKAA